MTYPESWGAYPEPHYDEYDDCMCPDHRAMRGDYGNLVRTLERAAGEDK